MGLKKITAPAAKSAKNPKQEESRTHKILSAMRFLKHLHQEIELAMEQANSQTTILAFTEKLPVTVEKWQKSRWSKRLYIMTPNGIFVGSDGPHAPPAAGGTHTWWTFKGVSRLLADGAEACAR